MLEVGGLNQGEFTVQGSTPEGVSFRHVANEPMAAQPSMVVCDGRAGDGKSCGAEAQVRRVHYKYMARLNRRIGEIQQVLSEVQYEINCPRCGWRTQVELASAN
jgi:hypothetical protein